MSAQSIPDKSRRRKMPDVLSFRAKPGFRDRVRAVAEAEGVPPGDLVRQAVSARLESAPLIAMVERDRADIVAFGGEQLARNIERAAVDDGYRGALEREVEASRFRFMDRLIAAHGHLGTYIAQQAALDPTQPVSPDDATEGMDRLRLAFAEMNAAHAIEEDLGRLVLGVEG